MKAKFLIAALLVLMTSVSSAQVASHAPTATKKEATRLKLASVPGAKLTGRVVARVNGAELTDFDLLREEYAIFPYGKQHNGIPKDLEPEIRKGALDMLVFEELLYQDAKRRGITVPAAEIAKAQREFRKGFPSEEVFQGYINVEHFGSMESYREKIRRSLLIEKMLKLEVEAKATVTPGEAKAYYDKNPSMFQRGESFHIQSISIVPPPNSSSEILAEAKKRANEMYAQAKNAKSYQEFGLLAEKVSDDDFHVNMGDHKMLDRDKLPPPIVEAALKMQAGQVSQLIQLGNSYTVFRLVEHKTAGPVPYAEVKGTLQSDLQKAKTQKVRAALGDKLRKGAKIETL